MANFVLTPDGTLINLDQVEQVVYIPENLRISLRISGREEMRQYETQDAYDDAKTQIDSQIINPS